HPDPSPIQGMGMLWPAFLLTTHVECLGWRWRGPTCADIFSLPLAERGSAGVATWPPSRFTPDRTQRRHHVEHHAECPHAPATTFRYTSALRFGVRRCVAKST